MDSLLETVQSTLKNLILCRSDDWIDRLNHVITVILLLVFALIVSEAQFVGNPIHCWCPAEFTGAFESYTNYYCWIKNTYFVPSDEAIPTEASRKEAGEITYYQWIPLILFFQAFLFKLPNIMWRLLNGGSGMGVDEMCRETEATQCDSPEMRKAVIDDLADRLDRWFTQRMIKKSLLVGAKARASEHLSCLFNPTGGTYLTSLYIFIKFVSLTNVIGQFFILNAFMATDYNMYGFEYIRMLSNGEAVRESPRFPRVTLCDFELRQLQNIQRWTVQCTLPINLFNEKIFIFLWFWFFVVACVTGINLVSCIYTVSMQRNNYYFVKKYLALSGNKPRSSSEKELCRKFAESYLANDGCLVLRMIGSNSTDVVVIDLFDVLWNKYKADINTASNTI